jgi:hypothetical protein
MFHVLTSILFPIGMFPYIMIATALIFFSAEFHDRIVRFVGNMLNITRRDDAQRMSPPALRNKIALCAVATFLTIQIALPLRYVLYPGELFWTEEGYRFSWRVMLMEKAGYAQFKVEDIEGNRIMVDNSEFLTPLQEKMMATQPDMILQYAHILRDHYKAKGVVSPRVYVESYVTLNGRFGKPFIDSRFDLATAEESFSPKTWILPFENDIKGF